MHRSTQSNLAFSLLTVAIVCLILHGSLYPYDFRDPIGQEGPIATLVGTWDVPPASSGDLLANLFLYIPFGLSAAFAFPKKAPVWTATLAGLLLCTVIEILQFYDAGRVTSASDIYLNTAGTLIGALAGRRFGARFLKPSESLNPVPCMLIAALVGYKLFPYVPTIDLHKYWHALKPLVDHPSVSPVALFRYFALWLTADYLVANAVKWRMPTWIPVALFTGSILGAKILIVSQALSPSEIAGAVCALALWLSVRKQGWAPALIGCVLCAAIIAHRLEPFDFQSTRANFGWLPFRNFLHGSVATNVQSMFEKAFLYGSLIWMAGVAGMRLSAAAAASALILLLTSFAEIHLPGRSGEITDALIALAMGACIFAVQSARSATATARIERSPDRIRL